MHHLEFLVVGDLFVGEMQLGQMFIKFIELGEEFLTEGAGPGPFESKLVDFHQMSLQISTVAMALFILTIETTKAIGVKGGMFRKVLSRCRHISTSVVFTGVRGLGVFY